MEEHKSISGIVGPQVLDLHRDEHSELADGLVKHIIMELVEHAQIVQSIVVVPPFLIVGLS